MEITVQFKEKYMDKPVTRTCVNMTKEQVINVYGLNEHDIEWYKFLYFYDNNTVGIRADKFWKNIR